MTDSTITGHWHIGHNLAGYMPESDVACAVTYGDAVAILDSDMRWYADTADDAAWDTLPADAGDDDHPTMLATVGAILTDDGPRDGQDFGAIVDDSDGRSISFWLVAVEDDACDGHADCGHDSC